MPRSGVLLLPIVLTTIQSCSTWKQRPVTAGVAPAVSTEHPVRITRVNGSVMVLEHPRIAGDSLLGDVGNPPQRLALALSDIQRLEERGVSKARTGGLIAGTGVVLYVIVGTIVAIVLVAALAGGS